jgi:hypothetical protein
VSDLEDDLRLSAALSGTSRGKAVVWAAKHVRAALPGLPRVALGRLAKLERAVGVLLGCGTSTAGALLGCGTSRAVAEAAEDLSRQCWSEYWQAVGAQSPVLVGAVSPAVLPDLTWMPREIGGEWVDEPSTPAVSRPLRDDELAFVRDHLSDRRSRATCGAADVDANGRDVASELRAYADAIRGES